MDVTTKIDLRSPLAKARDEWLNSDQAALLIELTLVFPSVNESLIRNRFERAFLAGARAQRIILEQEDVT